MTWLDNPGPGTDGPVDVFLTEHGREQFQDSVSTEEALRVLDEFDLPNGAGVLILVRTQ